jgi:hypothetical protein
MLRSGVTNEGALYELVARGNKDTYFLKDDFSAVSPFDMRYKQTPAHVHERRRIPPLNSGDFGRTCEWEFEVAGDIVTDPTILIDLPSWLPPHIAAQNKKTVITDLSGQSHGYTNGVAYFLFSKIQIYVDQILLQEFSGDALFGTTRSRGSLNSAFLDNVVTGTHKGTQLDIQHNATPGQMRLRLPFVGCQHPDDGGFPSVSARQQTYKVRATLRKLEDLVEASDGRSKPIPWETTMFMGKEKTPFQTLSRTAIGQPTLQLETRHIYVDSESKQRLLDSELEIPYSRLYENTFTYGATDYAPLKRNSVATATRRLDAVHPASKIVFWGHTQASLMANQYAKVIAPTATGEYYNNIALYVAGRDRESIFPPLIWNKIQTHAKEERDAGPGYGFMNWELGDIRGREVPFARQPEGTVNFSSADRPTLYIDLAAHASQNLQLTAVVDTWAVFQTAKGRAGLKYGN